jgi:hypothetical protein
MKAVTAGSTSLWKPSFQVFEENKASNSCSRRQLGMFKDGLDEVVKFNGCHPSQNSAIDFLWALEAGCKLGHDISHEC